MTTAFSPVASETTGSDAIASIRSASDRKATRLLNHSEHCAKALSLRTGFFATLGALLGFGGRRVPSQARHRTALLALAASTATLLALAPLAHAGLGGDHFLGGPTAETGAGEFNNPTGVAVNDESTADAHDGFLYVADDDNHRIQAFDSAENFQFMFGGDVVKAGGAGDQPGVNAQQSVAVAGEGGTFSLLVPDNFRPQVSSNERQAIEVVGTGGSFALVAGNSFTQVASSTAKTVEVSATGGSFTLRLFGPDSPPIPHDASAATVEAAIEALTVGSGGDSVEDVTVTGPPGGPWVVVELIVPSFPNLGANNLQAGSTDGLVGSPVSLTLFNGERSSLVPRNGTAAEVDAALETIAKIGAGNVEVTGPSGGPWNVEFVGAFARVDVPNLGHRGTDDLTGSPKSISVLGGVLTAAIVRAASAAEVDAALEAVGSIGPGNVEVTGPVGGPWNVEFVASLASTLLNRMSGRTTNLTGSPKSVDVATVASGGGAALEICTVAADCRGGLPGSPGGFLDNPQGIAIDQSSGHLFVLDGDNRRVQEFAPDGTFVRAFGFNVDAAGGPGGFETCFVAADCVAGNPASGANLGLFDDTGSLAISPVDGHLFATDPERNRVMEFEVPVSPAAAVAAVGQFGEKEQGFSGSGGLRGQLANESTGIAVGPDGVVYVASLFRIIRYDSVAGQFLPNLNVEAADFGMSSSIAVDLTSNRILLGADASSSFPNSQILEVDLSIAPKPLSSDGESRPLDSDEIVDRHIPNSGEILINAFGFDHANGKLYASTSAGHRLLVADADGASPPALFTISPATHVTAETAKVSGTINPNGPAGWPSRYRWEYSGDDGATWQAVGDYVDVGHGTTPIPVEASLTGLGANATYLARIAAHKLHNPDRFSPQIAFTTDAVPPTAATLGPHNYGDTWAQVGARINPRGSATRFRFEYGETDSYGSVGPTLEAGSKNAASSLSARIDGLQPETTYHFRVVAESDQGTVVGGDRTFTTRSEFSGFPGRAYEQVSPVVKPESIKTTRAVARDGNAAVMQSQNALAGAEWGAISAVNTPYLSRRSADGWRTVPVFPRPEGQPGTNAFGGADLSQAVINSTAGWHFQATPQRGAYLRDLNVTSSIADSMALLAPASDSGASPGATESRIYRTATADMSHVVFESVAALTEDAGIPPAGAKVYERVDGATRLVSVSQTGAPFGAQARVGSGSTSDDVSDNAISEDGNHIFFSTPATGSAVANGTEIYRRDHGSETIHVSPSKRSSADPLGPRGKAYVFASAQDGDGVFFTSREHLTDDANTGPSRAGNDLYRYEVSTDTLIDVSATAGGDGARVQGVLGVADDAASIYYVARGQVLAGEGVAGEPNLYLWREDGSPDGETRFIATLAGGDAANWAAAEHGRTSRVSADGSVVLFESSQNLTGFPTGGLRQAYVYEAGDGADALSCISCPPSGAPMQGASTVGTSGGMSAQSDVARNLSSDGRRAYFESGEDLLPADVNGTGDVYEWQAGELRLISTGKDDKGPASFVGASTSGDDVFFTTFEQLVGQDGDTMRDIYDARVGGGIAAQSPPPPDEPCQGDGCKPAETPAPAGVPPLSTVFQSEGNYAAPFAVGKINAKQRKQFAKRGRMVLRVKTTQPGRVLVRAVKGKRVFGAAAKKVPRPMTTRVVLRLRRYAMRILGKRGKLRLRVEVRFAGEVQKARISLRSAGKTRKRSPGSKPRRAK